MVQLVLTHSHLSDAQSGRLHPLRTALEGSFSCNVVHEKRSNLAPTLNSLDPRTPRCCEPTAPSTSCFHFGFLAGHQEKGLRWGESGSSFDPSRQRAMLSSQKSMEETCQQHGSPVVCTGDGSIPAGKSKGKLNFDGKTMCQGSAICLSCRRHYTCLSPFVCAHVKEFATCHRRLHDNTVIIHDSHFTHDVKAVSRYILQFPQQKLESTKCRPTYHLTRVSSRPKETKIRRRIPL